ncbi:hypothetical protein GW17_00052706, partial [Ensete ventricosum]
EIYPFDHERKKVLTYCLLCSTEATANEGTCNDSSWYFCQLRWISFLEFSDCLLTSFSRLQDELLGLTEVPNGDPIYKNSSLDMDVLYRTGETQQVNTHLSW